jgi:hypothetical protein
MTNISMMVEEEEERVGKPVSIRTFIKPSND